MTDLLFGSFSTCSIIKYANLFLIHLLILNHNPFSKKNIALCKREKMNYNFHLFVKKDL